MKYTSAYYITSALWEQMETICDHSCNAAMLLIPTFLGIYFLVAYGKNGLDGQICQGAIVTTLAKGMGLILFIVYFKEFMTGLDSITATIMDELNAEQTIESYLDSIIQSSENNSPDFLSSSGSYMFPSMYNFVKNISSGFMLMFLRNTMHLVRNYLLIFSTQVGPLSIAMAALPGRYGALAVNWFQLQFSLFFWGITMCLVDLMLVKVDCFSLTKSNGAEPTIMDCIHCMVLMLMYVLVSTLTSFYVGGMLGGTIFNRVSAFITHQIASGTSVILKRYRV